MRNAEWILCPVCGNKTHNRIREDTVLKNYLLYCPKCKFEQRSGNHSTVFVGQYPVDEWHGRLGGGTQADSIMDRIIHNAYEIPTNETNLRKLYDSKKLKKLVDEIES